MRRPLFLVLLWAALAPAIAAAVEFDSPAIEFDDAYNRGRHYRFDRGPVVLMASLRVRKTGMTERDKYASKDSPPDDIAEVLIDRIYFGSPPASPPRVRVHKYLDIPADGDKVPYVYTLTAHGFDEPIRYSLSHYDADDQQQNGTSDKHLRALGQARLDTMVLTCDSIFVGRPLSKKKKPAQFTVRVERVLLGKRTTGEEVVLRGEEREPIPLTAGESYLYFTVPKTHRSVGRWHDDPGELLTRWSMTTLETVQASIARRELLLKDPPKDNIELVLPGSRAEAIDLVGSPNRAIQLLGSRRLARDGAAAVVPDLLKEIRGQFDRRPKSPPQPNDFLRQANMIEMLGVFEGHRRDGEIARLTRELFEHAERGGEFPRNPRARPDERVPPPDRYHQLDAATNHSLAWLLLSLKPRDMAELFGERLLKLRDLAQYGWKDEAQSVIDLQKVEDRLQLPPLEARSKTQPVVRWEAGSADESGNSARFAFSPDGRWFAIVGDLCRVWDAASWTQVANFPIRNGTLVRPAFAADGGSFLVVPATVDSVDRWDWRKGEVTHRYRGVDSVHSVELSSDGKALLVGGNRDPVPEMVVFDAESAAVVKRFPKERWSIMKLSPDGKQFLAHGNPLGTFEEIRGPVTLRDDFSEWYLGRVTDDERRPLPFEPYGFAWGASDRIWSLEPKVPLPKPTGRRAPFGRGDNDGKPRPDSVVRKRRIGGDFAIVAEFPLTLPFDQLAMSRDGKTLVLVHQRQVEVLGDDGRSKGRWLLPPSNFAHLLSEIELSPDGRFVAIEPFSRSIQMFETATGKRVPLNAAHLKPIESLALSPDGGELTTGDDEGVTCRWDTRTGQIVKRTQGDPPTRKGYRSPGDPVVARAEDGQFWIFSDLEDANGKSNRVEIRVHDQQPPKIDRFAADPDKQPKPVGKVLAVIEPKWGRREPAGLVPGREWFHIGAQIYSRRDLRPVSAINPAGWIRSMQFSEDGSRYALVTQEFWHESSLLGETSRRGEDVYRLRVHDTRTGATLFSVPTKKWAEHVAFSRDKTQLAAVVEDLAVEVWTLPK